jgi:hypothetical protein
MKISPLPQNKVIRGLRKLRQKREDKDLSEKLFKLNNEVNDDSGLLAFEVPQAFFA